MKWTYSDEKLCQWIATQRSIFEQALKYVAPKGKIVYMTHSILPDENTEQVRFFCEKYGLYLNKEPKHALTQSRGLDGFFCAVMER